MNTTHTVRFELPPSRILRFCIGIAVIYAVISCRSIISGFFQFKLGATGDSPFGSVTAVVLPLLIEFVIAIGSCALFIWSVGWGLLSDLVGGIYQTFQMFRAQNFAASAAASAARDSAGVAAGTVATVAATSAAVGSAAQRWTPTDPPWAGRPPEPPPVQQQPSFEARVQSTLRAHRDQLVSLESKISEIQSDGAEIKDLAKQLIEMQTAKQPAARKRTTRGASAS